MKATDLAEVILAANDLFKHKYNTEMEVFDFVYNDDDYDGSIRIHGCGAVEYETGGFGYGQKRGKKPYQNIEIEVSIEKKKVSNWKVSFKREDS